MTDKAVHGHVEASSCADHENERLRGELQSLQAALQHTQSALVDKHRGSGAKFVGGGQFRGSSENTRSKAGLDKKCGECAAAKALLRKAKLEAESLMITRRTLQADLSHTETGLHQAQQQMAVTDLELEEISLSTGEMGGELDQMESALRAHHNSLHGWHEQARPCMHSLHACTRSLLLARALCPLPLSHRPRPTPARRLRTVCNFPHPPTTIILLPLSQVPHGTLPATHPLSWQMETARVFELSALAKDMQAVERAKAQAEQELEHALHYAHTPEADADADAALQLQLAALAERLAAAQQAHVDSEAARARECDASAAELAVARAAAAEWRLRAKEAARQEVEGGLLRASTREAEAEASAAAACAARAVLGGEEELLAERTRLVAEAAAAREEAEVAHRQMEAAEAARAEEAARRAAAEAAMATLRAELDAARRQLGTLNAGARETAALRCEHEGALRTQAACLGASLGGVERAEADTGARLAALAAEVARLAPEAVAAPPLRVRVAALGAELDVARTAAAARAAVEAEAARLRAELAEARRKLGEGGKLQGLQPKAMGEIERLRAEADAAEQRARKEAERLAAACVSQARAEEEARRLRAQVDSVTSMARVLKDSLQSLVRLCVVAPTVNVSFGAQVAACKAPLPQGKIKDVLETQILPRFTSCFAQLQEGVAPNGSTMDAWLQDLTAEMQGSIEKHLSKVFREEG